MSGANNRRTLDGVASCYSSKVIRRPKKQTHPPGPFRRTREGFFLDPSQLSDLLSTPPPSFLHRLSEKKCVLNTGLPSRASPTDGLTRFLAPARGPSPLTWVVHSIPFRADIPWRGFVEHVTSPVVGDEILDRRPQGGNATPRMEPSTMPSAWDLLVGWGGGKQ